MLNSRGEEITCATLSEQQCKYYLENEGTLYYIKSAAVLLYLIKLVIREWRELNPTTETFLIIDNAALPLHITQDGLVTGVNFHLHNSVEGGTLTISNGDEEPLSAISPAANPVHLMREGPIYTFIREVPHIYAGDDVESWSVSCFLKIGPEPVNI